MIHTLLKSEKQYRKLFMAGIVNGIGDRFSSVAVLAMLLHLTGSGWAVGNTLAIRLLPSLFFGPAGGWMAERFSRKTILVVTDLIRIGFALSFLLVQKKEDIWIIYVSSFILAAGEAIYEPVRKSGIPRLVDKKHLVQVNSLEQVMTGIVLIIGALLGGIISAIFGDQAAFCFNAVSFLGSAVITSSMIFPEKYSRKSVQEAKHNQLMFMIKKVILLSFPVQILLVCEILVATMNGVDNVLISVYAVKEFHLGEVGVGLFYGALGIGLMLSFSVSSGLRKNLLFTGLLCLLLEGLSLVILSRTGLAVVAFFMLCCTAFMSGVGNACFDTILMKEIPAEHQGIIFGFLTTILNTLLGISMFISGTVLQYLPPRFLGLIGGIAYMTFSIFLIAIMIRKV